MKRVLYSVIIGDLAKGNGLRTLVYAYKDISNEEWDEIQLKIDTIEDDDSKVNRTEIAKLIEHDLTFVTAFGI